MEETRNLVAVCWKIQLGKENVSYNVSPTLYMSTYESKPSHNEVHNYHYCNSY